MNTRITPNHITELKPNEIFVFGSNLQGYHGGGAARLAMNQWGAVWGQGTGLQGQTYAIPTMQGGIGTIRPYIDQFIKFAQNDPERTFLVPSCRYCTIVQKRNKHTQYLVATKILGDITERRSARFNITLTRTRLSTVTMPRFSLPSSGISLPC